MQRDDKSFVWLAHDGSPYKEPIKVGAVSVYVGFCTLYDEGPTVLLTFEQHGGALLEIAMPVADVSQFVSTIEEVAESLEEKRESR